MECKSHPLRNLKLLIMKKNDFSTLENLCTLRYLETGKCFHLCSQENHPVLFHNDEEFKAAMNVVAFVAFLLPELHIYTFEIMDNHFHFVLSGRTDQINNFTRTIVSRMSSHTALSSSRNDIRRLDFKVFEIGGLDNLRNVIAYINRNGAVANPNVNVFSYKWGANRYFFNEEAKLRYKECGRETTCRERRSLFCSAKLDGIDKVILLDGYVSPMCYCEINAGETYFRDSRHYFQSISRNIEAAKDIAKSIGESVFYTDEDLFSHIRMQCSKRYQCQSVASLPKEAKIELAKELHYDYNAGNKQISRLLKLDIAIVSALFPSTA